MPRANLPLNDGWEKIDYEVGTSRDDNERISNILNDACHVFRRHASGTWLERDRDIYAGMLAKEIAARPGLAGRLLLTEDRVVKMLTHRALELLKSDLPK